MTKTLLVARGPNINPSKPGSSGGDDGSKNAEAILEATYLKLLTHSEICSGRTIKNRVAGEDF